MDRPTRFCSLATKAKFMPSVLSVRSPAPHSPMEFYSTIKFSVLSMAALIPFKMGQWSEHLQSILSQFTISLRETARAMCASHSSKKELTCRWRSVIRRTKRTWSWSVAVPPGSCAPRRSGSPASLVRSQCSRTSYPSSAILPSSMRTVLTITSDRQMNRLIVRIKN